MKRIDRARMTVDLLAEAYPEAVCELDYRSPWELLVATVLSAQCTDQRVNQVTPQLFKRWPGPDALAEAELEDLENTIRITGLYRSKARNLRRTARVLVTEHGSVVPRELDGLVRLPGVGRKTAKVVLGEAFGVAAGVAVDTHVKRLAGRIGLSSSGDPDRVARDLEALVPKPEWVDLSKRLVLHGRRVCRARRPSCDSCCLAGICARIGV
ncbi:MAG: endonuclease III [Candidatus Sulfomarinibacteraceae bacterium]